MSSSASIALCGFVSFFVVFFVVFFFFFFFRSSFFFVVFLLFSPLLTSSHLFSPLLTFIPQSLCATPTAHLLFSPSSTSPCPSRPRGLASHDARCAALARHGGRPRAPEAATARATSKQARSSPSGQRPGMPPTTRAQTKVEGEINDFADESPVVHADPLQWGAEHMR